MIITNKINFSFISCSFTLYYSHSFFFPFLYFSKVFDHQLCVRQLRYSGMMETAKIRKAGYPVRHIYYDFVERYRILLPGLNAAQRINCQEASKRICQQILHNHPNFEFGHTKVFLKEIHDQILEDLRSKIYQKSILILQRGFRRVIFRRWIRRYRKAVIDVQKHWRARGYRSRFLAMRNGYRRLQACIRSRQLAYDFNVKKKLAISLQAHCRGYLTRRNLRGKMAQKSKRMTELLVMRRTEEKEFKKAGHGKWMEMAEENYRARVTELHHELEMEKEVERSTQQRTQQLQSINIEEHNKVVDDVFRFLQDSDQMSSPEQQPKVKTAFGVSKMLLYFEAKSRNKKHVPTKLLSAPVNSYEGELTRF
jgi:myosin VIIa